jgi:hypothetical protein
MSADEQEIIAAEVAHEADLIEEPASGALEVLPTRPTGEWVSDEGEIDPLDIPDHYDLPMYGSILLCPKCSHDKVRTEYHSHGVLSEPCGTRFGWPDIQNLGEHLCRTCGRCRYGWPEQVFSGA